MPTMKTNTATIDALIAKANRLPERGGGGLPAGISAIDFGTFDLDSAVSGSATFSVPHKLGAAPDLFLFWSPANIATTYSELAVMRAADFGWRGGTNLNKCWFHGNSTSTVTGADATTSYGIKTMGTASVTIAAHSTSSYIWRAGTYKYLAIKFG